MAHHTPVQVDKKVLKDAQALWSNFMVVSKYFVIGVVVLLAVLGLLFV